MNGFAVIFVYSDGVTFFGPINALTPTVPVARDSCINGFILPDDVDTWGCTFRIHKKGGAHFQDDYSLEAPTCFPGTILAVDNGQGLWLVSLSGFQNAYPYYDMPIVIVPQTPA